MTTVSRIGLALVKRRCRLWIGCGDTAVQMLLNQCVAWRCCLCSSSSSDWERRCCRVLRESNVSMDLMVWKRVNMHRQGTVIVFGTCSSHPGRLSLSPPGTVKQVTAVANEPARRNGAVDRTWRSLWWISGRLSQVLSTELTDDGSV